MAKKLSIVTICRNEGWKIRQTVESVLHQSFKDFEYIVIDGASTDQTLEILQEYRPQFSHFVSEPDRGIYNAQNKGLSLATGEYVLFLNGGDYLARPDVLQKVFSTDHAGIDILYGDLVVLRNGKDVELGRSPARMSLEFLLSYTLWHPVSFIRRRLFEDHGGYDESYRICADYDFFLKVIGVHNAPTKHVAVPVAVFNTDGIGSRPEFDTLHQEERKRAQNHYFPTKVLEMHQAFERLSKDRDELYSALALKIGRKLAKVPFMRQTMETAATASWQLYRKLSGKDAGRRS